MHDVVECAGLFEEGLGRLFDDAGAEVASVSSDAGVGVGGFQPVEGAGEFLVGGGGDGDFGVVAFRVNAPTWRKSS